MTYRMVEVRRTSSARAEILAVRMPAADVIDAWLRVQDLTARE